jgi:hypothetical protein
MNYLFKTLFFCFLLLGIFSCKDDIYNNVDQKASSTLSKTNFEVLSFSSKDELLQAIQNGMSDDKSTIITKGSTFISLLSPCHSKTKSTDGDTGDNYYETLGYDTLVPNQAFAKLINPEGEIMVKDSIYKITPNGTYYFPSSKKQIFDQLYSADSTSCGVLISDNLYKISDGIFRINTFKSDKYDLENLDNNESVSTKAGVPEPSFDSFPVYDADHHTWIGKLIQNIIGSSKEFCIKYDGDGTRRIKGSFYFYNYGVYSEIGAQGWTDKKNWIGWSKTASDELRVGWRNIVLETKIPDYLSESLKAMNTPSVSNNMNIQIPGTIQQVYGAVLVVPDFDPTVFDRVETYGAKALYDYLKGRLGNQSSWQKAEALLIATRTHLYTYIPNEDVKKFNEKSYTHVFANQSKFMVSLDPNNLPGFSHWSDALAWANAVKGTTDMAFPTLKSGEVYTCARFGNAWKGMKIVKN